LHLQGQPRVDAPTAIFPRGGSDDGDTHLEWPRANHVNPATEQVQLATYGLGGIGNNNQAFTRVLED